MPRSAGARCFSAMLSSLLVATLLVGTTMNMVVDRAEAQNPPKKKVPVKKVTPKKPKPGDPPCSGFYTDPNGNCSAPADCVRPPNNICVAQVTVDPVPMPVAGVAADNTRTLISSRPCATRNLCGPDKTSPCVPKDPPFLITTKTVADGGPCEVPPVLPPIDPAPTPAPVGPMTPTGLLLAPGLDRGI